MEIKEDIFEDFFRKLAEDKEISESVVSEPKELWKNEEIASQKKSSR